MKTSVLPDESDNSGPVAKKPRLPSQMVDKNEDSGQAAHISLHNSSQVTDEEEDSGQAIQEPLHPPPQVGNENKGSSQDSKLQKTGSTSQVHE